MNQEQRNTAVAYKTAFATDAGVKVLADLAKQCFAATNTFMPASAEASAFNAGMREVYLRIKRRIETNLDEVKPEQAIREENQ